MIAKEQVALHSTHCQNLKLFIVDAKGAKVACSVHYDSNRVVLEKGNLDNGTYFFILRNSGQVLGNGKVVVMD